MTKKKKKTKESEYPKTGALYPVGMGGPGIDWTKLNEQLNKKVK